MIRHLFARLTFLLAGIALALLIANGFLWYGAAQSPDAPFVPVLHERCGEPVVLRAETYNRLGGTRPGDDIEIARIDFCDPVRLVREDGVEEVWFWLEVESTGQTFPLTGWGYPWSDVERPFPNDAREPRNPWWNPRNSIRAVPTTLDYLGGDGYACALPEIVDRGVDLFFAREEGFQLPVGSRHAGWVCLYFIPDFGLPEAFTVTLQPDRARITQWVDKLFVVRDSGLYDVPAMPVIQAARFCDFARRTHPASIRAGEVCEG
jgi:hypothetical protein